MDTTELDRKSENLEALKKAINDPFTGIRLDILNDIISELNSDPRAVELFGENPTTKMAIISQVNDLKIIDVGPKLMTDEQKTVFLSLLGEIFTRKVQEARKNMTR
jgi:hypothetical protein